MDSREMDERLARIEAKLDRALEAVAMHGAYIKIGAALVALLASAVVHSIWK